MNTQELTEALARLNQDGETAVAKAAQVELDAIQEKYARAFAILQDLVIVMNKKEAIQYLDPERDEPLPFDEQDVYTWLDQTAQSARRFVHENIF